MWIIEFLQTRTGQHAVALSTVMIIGISFLLLVRPSKKAKRKVVPSAQWTISHRFMYLNALVKTCDTLTQLHQVQKEVKGFARETFSEVPTLKERHWYTSRLLESYYNREQILSPGKAVAYAN